MEIRTLAHLCTLFENDGCPPQVADTPVTGICTDTRRVERGELFIPFRGERVDGHDYIETALYSGCAACLSEHPIPNQPVVVVKDTRRALRQLAAGYRREFSPLVCAVTGSVGKTTLKEMIASVFGTTFQTLKTAGNFNNEIGLPLTVLRLERDTQALVLEMGMSNAGEISRLTEIACPDIAVINNIGVAHIENLGSREAIRDAKLEVIEGMPETGSVILNGDEPLLLEKIPEISRRVMTFAMDNSGADVFCLSSETLENGSRATVQHPGGETEIFVPAAGRHNVSNALAAFAAGLCAGISPEKIAKGIAAFTNTGMRQNIYTREGITVIEDCYNANPQSMRAALSVLRDIRGERRIAVLGTMRELGAIAPCEHCEIGSMAAEIADELIFCGKNAEDYARGARAAGRDAAQIHVCEDALHAGAAAKALCRPGDIMLFKGSRGEKMEEAIRAIF
ncbi:MAG: UDP-N-acetylmuramoyl-tripeptide--D-alanyl-D-alanine ligase [Clostridia bacterium]|nr:UDP-N-acetylmuramoyl-tripeptide--D-alanyl-D-alanine ligase [Clostridia bacterium]